MWYNLVKDFRYITVNSLLKKLKNILNIQGKKSAVLVTVFMILFAVVAPVLTLPTAKAADLFCTYNHQTSQKDNRGATDMVISFSSVKDAKGNQIGVDGVVDVRYQAGNPNGVDYNNSLQTCSPTNVQAYVTIEETFALASNQPVSNKIFLKDGYKFTADKDGNGKDSLRLQGSFSIPSFKDSGLNIQNLLPFTKTNGKVKDNIVVGFHTIENGFTKTPFLSTGRDVFDRNRSLSLFVCENATLICADYKVNGATTTSDPTTTNDLEIKLGAIKLAIRPGFIAGVNYTIPDPKKAFIRTFIDENGKINPVNLEGFVIPTQPNGKTIYINFENKTTSVLIGDPASTNFRPKLIKNIGAQVFNKKVKFASDTDYGCIKDNFTTTYVIGNETVAYNLCNPVKHDEMSSGYMQKADGSKGYKHQFILDDVALKNLKATTQVVCTDPKKGEGCNDVYNTFQISPLMTIEAAPSSDTSWTSFISQLGAVAAKYIMTWKGIPFSYDPADVYVQIYPSAAAYELHKNDKVPDSVPDIKDVESSAQVKSEGLGQSLYAFIVRVISVVITWLQTIIYAAFAYILVPVLNALLKVRPYKDTFVNIIYPGWLILRNLANIFFIVSLLVVGLKILFQQSAASTAKNFILRLVLMALLVNFSLVISQGIVGIADTVQSQFLPADSKIIEALGSKLMVEPLKNFRDQVAGANDTFTPEKAEGSIADTVKPLVLLMLSLASFFSFAALAAFLLVRLVVLWVLYMTSPVAYVGYVMEETQTYAKQWWKEFLKYVIMTPVLVFFLNIAALMATLFSGQDNSIFEFSEGIAGDIVAATMTIISHFIVLFFIYVGMKFALSSGTIGAKTIVDYAKKGFDTFTSKPAKWAAGQAQTQWDRRFKGGMLDPKAHIGAFKEQVDKTTKAKMEKRLGSKANKLTPEGLYSNPKRALKYVLGGASAGTEGFQNEINAKRDEAAILTEAERDALTTALPTNLAKLNLKQNDMQAMDDGKLSLHMAKTEIFNKLDDKIRSLEESKLEEVAELTRRGRISDADELGRDYDRQIASLTNVKTKIGDAMLASTDGKIVLDAETKDKVSVVFDADDVKAKLKDDVTDLENDINALTKDAERRNKYGYGVAGTTGAREIDFNRQMQLKNEAEKLEEQMNDHAMPVSGAARNARLTRESEAAKKIAHLEGEELRYAFKKAMADNNMDLAAAIAKKSAQEGDADMLLKEHGFKNNIEDFHKFINQKFASFGPTVRAQIGSEISALADKNGNAAIGKAYRVNNSGQLVGRTMQEQAKKVNTSIAKSPPEDVFKKKPTEISRQIGSNKYELYEGIVTNLNTMNKEKLKNMVRRMPAKTAQFIQKSANFNQLSLDVKLALEKTANKS